MTITAKIIADSVGESAPRLTTMELRYPRFIHAEELTHRVLETQPQLVFTAPDGLMYDQDLSRNASSSRAIPVERLIQDVLDDPVAPAYWGRNQKGMQAREELEPIEIAAAEEIWLEARMRAVESARSLLACGVHKQIANRILEPFSHINVVVTATEWSNFFALRDHPDAQPEIRALAQTMKQAMRGSTPKVLRFGEWHLPYVTIEDSKNVTNYAGGKERALEQLRQISAARCARVSYKTHDGRRPSIAEDLALFQQLVGGDVIHASPLEHQATPDTWSEAEVSVDGSFKNGLPPLGWFENEELHGNLTGWIQHRKLIPNENILEVVA